jgi:tRNA uridine 5-carboxymethylaminomethyl modification enzyme
LAYEIGLADKSRYDLTMRKYDSVKELTDLCDSTNLTAIQVNSYLTSVSSTPLSESKKISDIALRPEVSLEELLKFVPRGTFEKKIVESVEISLRYRGYIEREKEMANKLHRLEDLIIPENFDFDRVSGLTIECRQKLKRYSPRTIAQASRISGVSPSDISVLLLYFGR